MIPDLDSKELYIQSPNIFEGLMLTNKRSLFKKWPSYLLLCLFFLTAIFPILVSSQSIQKNVVTSINPYHYYTYQEMTDFFHSLKDNHSDIMSLTSIGTTYEGRDIWMVKLSDSVELNEEEPGVLLMGAHHGNEKPSFEILIYFIKYMVENFAKNNTDNDQDGLFNEDPIDGFDNDNDSLVDEDPSEDRVRDAINNTQIFLIPMVNPDGVEYGGKGSRKNRAPNHGPFGYRKEITSYGVNLNRNYGYDWFFYKIFPLRYHFFMNVLDSSLNYRGPYPFSENETQAVKNFVETKNITISLSYHSFSEVIFYPWMHTSRPTPDEDLFISVGENISKINKYRLVVGKNYKIPRYGGTLGTSENWLYGEIGILSYTIELCSTRAPDDPEIVHEVCLTHVGVNLYVCERSWIAYL
ncbi:MAG: M14 family zinc carboxypeptidase [Atribacterota bacterium]